MCCSGMRCHMKTCSCVCMRCRNCGECSHPFGIGMGAVVAGTIAGSLGGQIMKSVNNNPKPQNSNVTTQETARQKMVRERSQSTSSTTSNGSTHGGAMVKAVGDNCVIQ